MSSTDRVFRILESELNKHLSFTFTIVDRAEPGTRRVIRPGQRFTVHVRLRNDSSLTMTDVRGVIKPTAHASFDEVTFSLDRVRGGETHTVARLPLVIEQAPAAGYVFDELLEVTVAARADLSRFRFHDRGRQVRYAQAASDLGGASAPLRTVRVTVPDRPRPSGVPLSTDVADDAPVRSPRRRRRGLGFLRLREAPGQP